MKPHDKRVDRVGAMQAAEKALVWHYYQMWHPDFDTTNFIQAWKDFRSGIPLADVYFSRGLPMPHAKNGAVMPVELKFGQELK